MVRTRWEESASPSKMFRKTHNWYDTETKAVRVRRAAFFYIEKTDNLINSIFTDKGKMTYDMIETMKYGYE